MKKLAEAMNWVTFKPCKTIIQKKGLQCK